MLHLQDPLYKDVKTFRNLLEDLEKIQSDVFLQLKEDVIDHEKFLARIKQDSKGYSVSEFSEKHRSIKSRKVIMADEF